MYMRLKKGIGVTKMSKLIFCSNQNIRSYFERVAKGDTIVLEDDVSKKRWLLFLEKCEIYESDVNFITQEGFLNMKDVKFDAIIGNPPYSLAGNKTGKRGRAVTLYDKFYKKSVELSSIVYMIVPDTSRNTQSFNNFIQNIDNCNKVIPIDDNVFDINQKVWCLVKDKNCKSPKAIKIEDVKWIPNEFPKQRVQWSKGKLNVTGNRNLLKNIEGEYTVYHKINGKGCIKYSSEFIDPKKCFPSDGYAVIMPQQIQKNGWTRTDIIKCDGKQSAMNGVNLAFVKTKEEAEYLVKYMKSDKFINQALSYCGGQNNVKLGTLKLINMDDYEFGKDKKASL